MDASKSSLGTDLDVGSAGVRIGTAVAGAYLSTIMGPEAGAGAGQALGELVEALVHQVLEKRPVDRVMRTLGMTERKIADRRANGERVRPEVGDPNDERAAAIFEAVVDAAARTFEERKAVAIANFYAGAAFNKTGSASDVLHYLRIICGLSWRQLIALRFFESPDREKERKSIDASLSKEETHIRPSFGDELTEMLRTSRLLGVEDSEGYVDSPADIFEGRSSTIGRVRPTGLGSRVSRLIGLGEIVEEHELDEIANDLRGE